jgi:S1-C subfamily serine protease
MKEFYAVVALGLLLAAPVAAAPTPLDRSTLSLDENVAINTICGAVRKDGASAYDACVQRQLASLQAHPSPDRSGLPARRNAAIEKACDHLRRVDIGEFNACLTKAMAEAPAPSTASAEEEELTPHIAKIFTAAEGKAEAAKPTETAPPAMPRAILPKRPPAVQKIAASPAELFRKVEKSVFVVLATPSIADAKTRNVAQGSAVAVSDQLLLTNCHVVEGRSLIKILQESRVDDATLVAADPTTDRCVLKSTSLKLTPVAGISSFDSLAVGTRAFAVGAPRSMERTLSEGLVSGLRHTSKRNLVQTSAPVSPGSSGGGLFDEAGNLIGITTLGSTAGTQNLNFAIAASDYWE